MRINPIIAARAVIVAPWRIGRVARMVRGGIARLLRRFTREGGMLRLHVRPDIFPPSLRFGAAGLCRRGGGRLDFAAITPPTMTGLRDSHI
jgi:hypothetical protein